MAPKVARRMRCRTGSVASVLWLPGAVGGFGVAAAAGDTEQSGGAGARSRQHRLPRRREPRDGIPGRSPLSRRPATATSCWAARVNGCENVSVSDPREDSEDTFFDAVGGTDTFRRLVATFYAGVAEDPVLRPLYPEEDLGPAEDRFRMFLEQYWGGPRTYSDERGHPRLRMRHAPFVIGPTQRDAWLAPHARRGRRDRAAARAGGSAVGLPRDGRPQHGQLIRMTARAVPSPE